MDATEHSKVIAFDTLFSTNHIQMLKVILPYMDNQTQKSMAVYIKFLELSYTIDFYKNHPYPLCGCMAKEQTPDFLKMCTELLPYCTDAEKKQIEQMRQFLKNMDMYKEMMNTMNMMKDVFPEMGNLFSASEEASAGAGPDGGNEGSSPPFGGFDIMGMLTNMLTPEQKEMFEMFGGNNHAE